MPSLLLSVYFPLFFPHTPTHPHTHNKHFSVMWLVECKISSLQLEENRFYKISFSSRGASKAWNGMAKHGTAHLVLSLNRPAVYLHGPAALTSSQLSGLTTAS